jgi:hypothetical protein
MRMYRVTNISEMVIGLVGITGDFGHQTNLPPGGYIVVDGLSEQIVNLADPAKTQVLVEVVEV